MKCQTIFLEGILVRIVIRTVFVDECYQDLGILQRGFLCGAYIEKKGRGLLGERKKDMSDISLNNGQVNPLVGLKLDYACDQKNEQSSD